MAISSVVSPLREQAAMRSPGPFFVAGTGRSGTSQLTRVIGEHPLVRSLAWESRFIVDPGGLEDLAAALTERYTPYHGDDALRRLSWLLGERLAGHTMEAFRGWDLPGEVGADRYWGAVDRLWEALTWYSFEEFVPLRVTGDGHRVHTPGEQTTNRRTVARYFADRAELIAILRTFVEELFGGLAEESGKVTWCEKTPFNLLSIPFLWELFPEATVIVAVRDPVSVVASHLEQEWAPSSLDDALSWLEPVYRRWLGQRDALLEDHRYVEARLEDLADDWPSWRKSLFERMGLADHDTPTGFDPERAHSRRNAATAEQVAEINRRIGWAIDLLGY
jgi:hypothetical protein